MGIFRKRRKFTRAEKRFLPIMAQQTEYVKRATSVLCKLVLSNDPAEWIRCEKEIKQYEVKGDAILAEFYATFYERMIPLINRDDLQVIAMSIDEFLDLINSSAKSVLLYTPEKIGQQFIDIAGYIDRSAEAMQKIIGYLSDIHSNFSAITHQCETITELEHITDEIYEEYITELFRDEKDAVNLMKNKNMAEVFEATTDAAKDFSDHIRMFMLRFL